MKIGWGECAPRRALERERARIEAHDLIEFAFLHFQSRYLSKTVSSYFPTQVTDVFTQGRDFATAVLPITGYSPISVITTIQRSLKYVPCHGSI